MKRTLMALSVFLLLVIFTVPVTAEYLTSAGGGGSGTATSGPGVSSPSVTVELSAGWNTIAVPVNSVSFRNQLKNQCDFGWYNQDLDNGKPASQIEASQRYYVWHEAGNEWDHPDTLSPSRGYAVYATSSCQATIHGTISVPSKISMQKGWNLVNIPEGVELKTVKDKCDLGWYNKKLSSGTSASQISRDEHYYFFTRKNGRMIHLDPSDTLPQTSSAYVYTTSDCDISFDVSGAGSSISGDSGTTDGSTDTGNTGSDTTTEQRSTGSENSDYSYDTTRRWDLSQAEFAALAGIRKGSAPAYPYSKQSLSNLVKKLRERAIDLRFWQYGASQAAEYANPEEVNVGGKTFFVSSQEGWVLQPGTPAPHCYYQYGYQPPKYGSLSDTVLKNVPHVDTKYADTNKDEECPSWLTTDLMDKLQSKLEKKDSGSSSQETFTDVSWNGWGFGTEDFTNSENDDDHLSDVESGSSLKIDTGYTGFCGKAFIQREISVDRRVKKVSVDVDVHDLGAHNRVAMWVGDNMVDNSTSEGTSTLTGYVGDTDTVQVGLLGDKDHRDYCDEHSRSSKISISSADIELTSLAGQ
ncbi:MAG: hypothetical protein ABEJ99_04545 [Candidatus Nanohaloarchaea archaeon]